MSYMMTMPPRLARPAARAGTRQAPHPPSHRRTRAYVTSMTKCVKVLRAKANSDSNPSL